MEMTSAFTLNVRLDNIAVITIDVPGEKMNTLKAEFASQVRAIIKQLRENKELRGVVFVSAKPDNFIAGADINMIGNCKTAQEAEALARQGQQLMAEIHALPIPVIAAIHGACLGGGLELALERAGLTMSDLTLIDMHEAFAAQTLANIQLLGSERFAREVLGRAHATGEVDDSKFNVLGGSIAYGHPFAATGARMITQTLHELHRRGGGFGLVTACAAGGLGAAMVLEAE